LVKIVTGIHRRGTSKLFEPAIAQLKSEGAASERMFSLHLKSRGYFCPKRRKATSGLYVKPQSIDYQSAFLGANAMSGTAA
jgi:hypothetical protein